MADIVWAEIGMPGWSGTIRSEEADGSVYVEGACPRCKHGTAFRIDRGLPGGLGAKGGRGDGDVFTVICACGYGHSDRPADSSESGCGAYWYDQEV